MKHRFYLILWPMLGGMNLYCAFNSPANWATPVYAISVVYCAIKFYFERKLNGGW